MATTLNKFFTYVTKTRANLSTFSRKPENFNGTIIVEINIMKKSSPINLKFTLCHCQNQNALNSVAVWTKTNQTT